MNYQVTQMYDYDLQITLYHYYISSYLVRL